MLEQSPRPSLKSTLRILSLRWAAAGFALTLLVSAFFFYTFSKRSADHRLSVIAQSVARSFRPDILDRDIRNAQIQMRRVLNLQEGEYIVVRNTSFKSIYAPEAGEVENSCKTPSKVCWDLKSGLVTYLHPIFFNEDLKDQLFGYVEVAVKNEVDWYFLGYFLLFLVSIFSVLAVGLFASQAQSLKILVDTFNKWARHLKESPDSIAVDGGAPFEELGQLEGSIHSLHFQIERLKQVAAKDAKAKTQLSMLREISHDLKTPVSQMAKFFSVLVSKISRTGKLDQEMVEQVQRSMTKVGDLIRQVEAIGPTLKASGTHFSQTDIAQEAMAFIEDFKKGSAFAENGLEIKVSTSSTKLAAVPQVQFYRILDNLVRNSCDAVNPQTGFIEVAVSQIGAHPTLIVRDNGSGISQDSLEKIFDAEFTTKPARGTGLGLSIVKKLCDDFSAEIKISSEVGSGTEFQVRFQPTAGMNKISVAASSEVQL